MHNRDRAHSFRRHLFCFPCSKSKQISYRGVSVCEAREIRHLTRMKKQQKSERMNEQMVRERDRMQKMCIAVRRCWTLRTHLKHAFAINLILCVPLIIALLCRCRRFFGSFSFSLQLAYFRVSWPKIVCVYVHGNGFFLANSVSFFVCSVDVKEQETERTIA